MRRGITAACIAALALAGCGGGSQPSASTVAQDYIAALANNNFDQACGYLDSSLRQQLEAAGGAGTTCTQMFNAFAIDWSGAPLDPAPALQKLAGASVKVAVSGSRATASISGNAVADKIGHLTLQKEKSGWKITDVGG